jgi:hypothetical protein
MQWTKLHLCLTHANRNSQHFSTHIQQLPCLLGRHIVLQLEVSRLTLTSGEPDWRAALGDDCLESQ